MSRIVYLNGKFVPLEQATVSVEDRGFLFGDGIYEVVRYYNSQPLGMAMHLDRLRQSLNQIRLPIALLDHVIGPANDADTGDPAALKPAHDENGGGGGGAFEMISYELMRRNSLTDGCVYWQVTRGVAPRLHTFPSTATLPTVYASAEPSPPLQDEAAAPQLRAITRPDARWQHCQIKAVSLLANVLDAQTAAEADCHEAILTRDGFVTEGTRRSILIVVGDQVLTYPLDGRILGSITRRIVLNEARQAGYTVQETRFSLEQLMEADEVIAVGSTTQVAAVIEVDDQPIANGETGPTTADLFERYKQYVFKTCGKTTTG
ncbi:MAG: aminotransferase class IV [Phycisphaeraceae bacterium]